MHMGSGEKVHKIDRFWLYGELRWLAHNWSHNGHISRGKARALKLEKKQRSKKLRRYHAVAIEHSRSSNGFEEENYLGSDYLR